MAQPFIGEIRMFAGSFAPAGWEFCNGQLLPISENDALFALLGTTYGGDGETTFALPDLRGRVPVHAGTGPGLSPRSLGARGGAEQATLATNQLPAHTHAYAGVGGTPTSAPSGSAIVSGGPNLFAGPAAVPVQAIGLAGAGQPHENRQPVIAIHFIISLFGIFPSPQ